MSAVLIQSALLALLGGAGGLVVGVWARKALIAAAPAIPRLASAGLDAPVLWFAATLSAGTCLLFGLLPAWQISRVDLADALRAGERGTTAPSVMRWRNLLTVAQVALSNASKNWSLRPAAPYFASGSWEPRPYPNRLLLCCLLSGRRIRRHTAPSACSR